MAHRIQVVRGDQPRLLEGHLRQGASLRSRCVASRRGELHRLPRLLLQGLRKPHSPEDPRLSRGRHQPHAHHLEPLGEQPFVGDVDALASAQLRRHLPDHAEGLRHGRLRQLRDRRPLRRDVGALLRLRRREAPPDDSRGRDPCRFARAPVPFAVAQRRQGHAGPGMLLRAGGKCRRALEVRHDRHVPRRRPTPQDRGILRQHARHLPDGVPHLRDGAPPRR